MFGISFTELFVIVLIAFLILGPEGFKVSAKKAGRIYKDIKVALQEIQSAVPDAKDLIEKTFTDNSDKKGK